MDTRLMLNWFRQRRKRALTEKFMKAVPTILARYGELLEKHPMTFVDETWLPVSKPEMKLAFQAGWKMAEKNEKMRKALEHGWEILSYFQPGIGNVPIDALVQMEDFVRLVEKTKPEREANLAEMRDFIRRNA